MTAEIAILSKAGVALAADSAVTLEIKNSQGTEKKIYNSSNKMFAMSKFSPVGIMVFGNASFMGFPWEVIIKTYRKKLWDKQFDNIESYAKDFLNFCIDFINKDDQEFYFKKNISLFFSMICSEIKKEVEEKTTNSTITLQEIKKIINLVIQNNLDEIKKRPTLPNFPSDFENSVIQNRKDIIAKQIKFIFEKLPLSKKNSLDLAKIAGYLFIKDIFPNSISGVVITGFGNKQNFPSLIEFSIDGVIDNVVKYKDIRNLQVSKDGDSIIVPFAQDEMVCTFMEGVDPTYQKVINGAISKMLSEYPKLLLENIPSIDSQEKEALLKELIKIGDSIKKEIFKNLENYRSSCFVSPVLDAVGALPKDEMAIMAETLVNLTSFKRKMSLDAETVGGPIDVAVISKGDGFVWIKRKHYFNPDLNHQFFKNYYNKLDDLSEA